MDDAKPYLPGVLGHISQEIGEEVAIQLARARGGRMVYVPKSPNKDMELVKIVGQEPAEKIAKLLGHGNLLIPLGSEGGTRGRHARIKALWQKGWSASEIAAEVDVHRRTVERVIAQWRDDPQEQLPFLSHPDDD